jgi:hypothetical protein
VWSCLTKNKKGESALDIARKYGKSEAAAVIQAAQKVFFCLTGPVANLAQPPDVHSLIPTLARAEAAG